MKHDHQLSNKAMQQNKLFYGCSGYNCPGVLTRVLPVLSQVHSQDEVTVCAVLTLKPTLYDKISVKNQL